MANDNRFQIHNGFVAKGSSTVAGSFSATTYYGDGSNLTGISGGGGGSASQASEFSSDSIGYLVNAATQKLYRLTRPSVSYTSSSLSFNGESIYMHSFKCSPGELINSIAMRIQTAGSAGLGLAAVRFVIYRSKLDANGNVVAGDLELDTGVNINTLTTGLKVVTGLNHTLSNNTVKDIWWMGLRNYQTVSLSVKTHPTTGAAFTWHAEINSSGSTMFRDNAWFWIVPWNAAMPSTAPSVSASAASTSAVQASDSAVLYCGISAT